MNADQKSLLEQRLQELNLYDLERLRECFKYELSIEPENEEDLTEILQFIMQEIDKKVQ